MHQKIVKHLIYPLHERVFKRDTFRYLKELDDLQWASAEEIELIQFSKLRNLLLHANENIPFYRKRFQEAGFDPRRLKSIDDFKVLPLLSKDEIKKNRDEMLWNDSPGGLTRYNTGGSSGEPLIFYFDRRRQAYDKAARALTHRWWGIDVGHRELYLWGSPVEITKQDNLKSIRDALTNELLLSAFEISEDNLPELYQQFTKFSPDCVFGYPSTITLFCQMCHKLGLRLGGEDVKAVFTAAEVLYPYQREYIGEQFGGVPVVDSYGSREGGFISHECPDGNYHVMDPNFIIEYVKDGKQVGPGEEGEIVITHLDAWGMPFIRYRTGDVACQKEGACSCGREWSMMEKIRGRTTDFIVTPDGRWQHALSLIYIVRDIEGVKEFKILQKEVDLVMVQVVDIPGQYPADGDQRIVDGFRKRMGEEVNVQVEHVPEIPRDASGKYRYVVSDVAAAGFR